MKALLSIIKWFFATPRRAAVTIFVISVVVIYGAFNPAHMSYYLAILWGNLVRAFGPILGKLLELAFVVALCWFLWTQVLFKKSAPAKKKK
jgi:hypothetical protein